MIICARQDAPVEQRIKNPDDRHASRSSSKADNHDRRGAGCDKGTSNGEVELGAIRLRKYDLLDEYRDIVFRCLVGL